MSDLKHISGMVGEIVDNLEVRAEVFRVIRANSESRSGKRVYEKIKEHLQGHATDEQIKDAIDWVCKKLNEE